MKFITSEIMNFGANKLKVVGSRCMCSKEQGSYKMCRLLHWVDFVVAPQIVRKLYQKSINQTK